MLTHSNYFELGLFEVGLSWSHVVFSEEIVYNGSMQSLSKIVLHNFWVVLIKIHIDQMFQSLSHHSEQVILYFNQSFVLKQLNTITNILIQFPHSLYQLIKLHHYVLSPFGWPYLLQLNQFVRYCTDFFFN